MAEYEVGIVSMDFNSTFGIQQHWRFTLVMYLLVYGIYSLGLLQRTLPPISVKRTIRDLAFGCCQN